MIILGYFVVFVNLVTVTERLKIKTEQNIKENEPSKKSSVASLV